MATVCGATLALMDAGVPMTAPVGGVAMGLVKEGDEYAVLTDIAGAEDHYGDMDFKVAGTRDGITALQMDIKVPNVTTAIMKEALEQARRGRLFILDKMEAAIAGAARSMSQYAPRIYTMNIPHGQDPRRHRTGRQGDSRHHRADRRQDRRRRRRHDSCRLGATRLPPARRCRSSPTSRRWPRSARPTSARWSGWSISARSSRSSPAPTACCTSARSPKTASSEVRDELKEGDQILVKVLALEGNKIKLSRKAVLREQREKLKAKH